MSLFTTAANSHDSLWKIDSNAYKVQLLINCNHISLTTEENAIEVLLKNNAEKHCDDSYFKWMLLSYLKNIV